MKHKLALNAEEFLKALKDASLYVDKDNIGSATSHVLLGLSQKTLSVIACDGRGYYQNNIHVCAEKGSRPSLPGKPMRIFIPGKDLNALLKAHKCKGEIKLEVFESQNDFHKVELILPDKSKFTFDSPAKLDVPDYARIRKLADKGKKSTVSLGQVMFPANELTRAGKVFPVKTGYTIPMYISQKKEGGLLTLMEYQSEAEGKDIKVIFMLGLSEAA